MLRLLDVLIRDLLVGELVALTTDAQVRFQPPDSVLRTDVVNLNQMALGVYLVDLRENRKLRTNERIRHVTNGTVFTEPAPERVDCHYLISAWSPTQPAPGIEPTLDEHALLYEAATALIQHAPFNPSRVYATAAAKLAAWPTDFQDADFPTAIVPPDGFGKLSEFWTTMGSDMRWKPCLYLVVTLPVVLLRETVGPMVTTLMVDSLPTGAPGAIEQWITIGGDVRRAIAGGTTPITGAWVELETLGGTTVQRVRTSDVGRFTFERLRPSQYRLRTTAVGVGVMNRVVDVPTETGEYDLVFP
jgi:uncharacterized protein DUF4255